MINPTIRFATHQRGLMLLLAICLMIGGLFATRHLPVDAFPDVTPVLVQVFTLTEGLAMGREATVRPFVTRIGGRGARSAGPCPVKVPPIRSDRRLAFGRNRQAGWRMTLSIGSAVWSASFCGLCWNGSDIEPLVRLRGGGPRWHATSRQRYTGKRVRKGGCLG